MTLGDYIKEYRQAHQCSMDEFASRSGMSKAYVSILERNRNPSTGKAAVPSLETIKRVAAATNVDFNDLIAMLDGDLEISLDSDFKKTRIPEGCIATPQKVGDRIRNTRKNAKLTQEDLARLLKLDRVTISKYESGAIDIPLSRLEDIANAFDMSITEFLNVDDDYQVTLRYDTTKKAPTSDGERDILDEVDVAFYGDFKELTDDDKETVRDMVRIMRERRVKKQE